MTRGLLATTRHISLLAATTVIGCATAPPPPPAQPLLPPPVDIEPLLPPPPARPALPERPFEDFPVPQPPPGLPGPGVLVSDVSYAESILDRSELAHLRVEVGVWKRLRHQERGVTLEVEAAYLARVGALERDLATERRWGKVRVWGGLIAGAAAVLLGAWVVGQVAR